MFLDNIDSISNGNETYPLSIIFNYWNDFDWMPWFEEASLFRLILYCINCMCVEICCSLQAPKSLLHGRTIVRLALQILCVWHKNWRQQNSFPLYLRIRPNRQLLIRQVWCQIMAFSSSRHFFAAQNIQSSVIQSSQFNSSRVLAAFSFV